ncbi:short-chain dehydrogenase/reductase-like protein SDR [Lojkania enalia]|uniref:Short-chain dehydrogenase/reductase-like protein SDR n=1 Tax=Lojkania enalia TaxID=147567 RepID=A0A9P4JW62_9PLEO|nr:short-chain dehydrogenase/reductase-like protein SDR [Didymosphaeria enalia]
MSTSRQLNILITGGARGIGRGLFRHFLSSGHQVIILDINEAELNNAKQLAPRWTKVHPIAGIPGQWKALRCDLANREEISTAVQESKEIFKGNLDVLINNAIPTPHIWSEGRAMEDDSDVIMEEWDKKIAVGLTAPFLLSRLCVSLLKSQTMDSSSPPGCIINISSTRAYQSEPDHESYSAVKAGILGLTQSMAVSLGHRHEIRVNAIIPGWIHVENENQAADKKGMKWEEGVGNEDMEWHPAGRVGKVEDIVRAVEYLVGAEFVTGQEIVVDGGIGRKMVYPE